MNKTLIAYFSASGVTASVAEDLAKTLEADLHEIVPAQRYTDSDLNWMDKKSRSTLEMTDYESRPEIVPDGFDVSSYDRILIGFPIWWYVEPRIIDTFLERYDFSGKTMIPFATSGSSGIEKAQLRLKEICPDANWKPGKRLTRSNAAKWANSL